MSKPNSAKIITEVFENRFSEEKFKLFILNLLKNFKLIDKMRENSYISEAYRSVIAKYKIVGTYTDEAGKSLDVLIVQLNKDTSLERARTAQRNFVADYLKNSTQGKCDAALVAFISPNEKDWRFSFVKLEYTLQVDAGKLSAKENVTVAKRFSFLVGENEGVHTVQSRFTPLIESEENPKLSDIEEAFNIEKVTNEFFEKYCEIFHRMNESLVGLLKKDPKLKEDFDSKELSTADFTKKTLGQMAFLYFLQKKGWFGVAPGKDWGTGRKNFIREVFQKKDNYGKNFFNDILEPLFYEALAQDRGQDAIYPKLNNCRMPFLNGGLFEPMNGYSWETTDVLLPDSLFSNKKETKEGDIGDGILDVFDRYNFTVNENDPIEKDVAVDPEMLGKVFENLLEVKDRKSKGAFYTPREIVHYMCQESIINFLSSELKSKISKSDLSIFIHTGTLNLQNEAIVLEKGKETDTYKFVLPETIRNHAHEIDTLLANIKVCDPAVGSGAFPLGMLNEIVRARQVLAILQRKQTTLHELKLHTISHSIYGVDIDSGAIEIAKLRLWLSLVVEEQNPLPLPNLDFKIMQGNSLLSEYEGIKLFNDAFLDKTKKTEMENVEISNKISALEKQILELFEQSKMTDEKELELKKQIKSLRKEKESLNKKSNVAVSEIGFFDDEITRRNKLTKEKTERLQVAVEKYVSESRRTQKQALKSEIDNLKWELIELTLEEQKMESKVTEIKRLRKKNIKPFFIWRLEFHDVFRDQNGFNIVIGNPPYIKEYTNRSAFNGLKNSNYYQGKMDIWYLFACAGIDLLKDGGVECFIAQNNWTTSSGASKMRKKVTQESEIVTLVDFGNYKVFESADIQTMIMLFLKDRSIDRFQIDYRRLSGNDLTANDLNLILKGQPGKNIEYLNPVIIRDSILDKKLTFSDNKYEVVLEKIKSNANFYLDAKTEVKQGIVCPQDSLNKKNKEKLGEDYEVGEGIFILTDEEKRDLKFSAVENELIKPLYTTSELIKYYGDSKNNNWIIYTDSTYKKNIKKINSYPKVKDHLDRFKKINTSAFAPYGLHRARDEEYFQGEKIIAVRKCPEPTFTYTDFDCYVSQTFNIIKSDRIDLLYLSGILNSKLVKFWLKNKGKMQGEMFQIDQEPIVEIPICNSSNKNILDSVKQKVSDILSKKKKDLNYNTGKTEAEIDQLIYKAYNLLDSDIDTINDYFDKKDT